MMTIHAIRSRVPDPGQSAGRLGRSVDTVGLAAATGALVTTLGCAAVGAENLHTGWRLVDWVIGLVLVGVPVTVAILLLRSVAAVSARLMRLVEGRVPGSHALATAIGSGIATVGRPWVVTLVVVGMLVWGNEPAGPLSIYHGLSFFEILIAAGTISGAIAGLAIALRGIEPHPRRTRATPVLLGIAGILALATFGWAVSPGPGDPIVREDAAALARIPPLDMPDPSADGPYAVVATSYGSGLDRHRREFGKEAAWTTPSADASRALPTRPGVAGAYADWFWGFGPSSLPLNALLWYPTDAPGKRPLILIVHGNHAAADYSDPGYAYLGEHLASRGFIVASIDENYLNGDALFDYGGEEIGVRAWLLLRHIRLFAGWGTSPGHPLNGRVDAGRVALIGHSRGGEAAVLATMMAREPDLTPAGLPPIPTNGIRAVLAIAPSDGMYRGAGAPVQAAGIDYLVIQGAHDGDLPGYSGLRTYHRTTLGTAPGRLKVAVFSQRANHGRFNSVWDDSDAGPLPSWLLDRGSILTPGEQQRLAKTVFTAFLARALEGATGYDAFFREPRAGRSWLPDDVIETHWETSERITTGDQSLTQDPGSARVDGADRVTRIDPILRDGVAQADRATALKWSAAASYEVAIDRTLAVRLEPGSSLVFSMAPWIEASEAPDPVVEFELGSGRSVAVRLSAVSPARPLLPSRLWKIEGIGERYLPSERQVANAERFMQTHEIPLGALSKRVQDFDPRTISRLRLRFDSPGSVLLDDIGFEPPIR